MKLLTASLTGKALDWALADALELKPKVMQWLNGGVLVQQACGGWLGFEGSADSILCLNLCLDHKLIVDYEFPSARTQTSKVFVGDTPEQAIARCVVAMRLGDEVEVPDELCSMFIAMMLRGGLT